VKPRPVRRLGLLPLALLAAACASSGSAPDERAPAIVRLLGPLGIDAGELGIRDAAAPVDPWRLRVVDHLLAHPLEAIGVARGLGARLHAERRSLVGIVTTAATFLDLEPRPPRPIRPSGMGGDALATLPPELRAIVLDLLGAMEEAAPRIRAAAARLSAEDRAFLLAALQPASEPGAPLDESGMWRFVELAERFDRAALVEGALIVAAAVDRAVAALRGWPGHVEPREPDPAWRTIAEGDVLAVADTPLGAVVIGGPGATTHRGDAALIVDLGGDDTYLGRAGGALGPDRPVAVVIDLGGRDRYVTSDDVAQGAGAFGVGVLVDLDGDDTFTARSIAQGAGAFGVGLLLDARGRDRYEARVHAQGAAAFGIGALADGRGHDRYEATLYAQGFGRTAGFGVLLDARGDDRYTIRGGPPDIRQPDHARTLGQGFAFGVRPLASGGIGLLLDARGSDRYGGEYFAQGASYWYGLGALVDDGGDDEYRATRYAQGAGIHGSVGVLWDGGGDDRYRARGVSQGVGHDWGLGILADAGGDDVYEATWLAQGAGNLDGLGLLIDLGGNDRYRAEAGDVQGSGRSARRSQSLGVLIDLGGNDAWARPPTGRLEWSGSGWGGALHADGSALGFSLAPRRLEPASLLRVPAPREPSYRRPDDPRFRPRDDAERRIQELLTEAADPEETAEGGARREAGRRELEALGPEALPALLRVLESLDVALANEAGSRLTHLGPAAHGPLLERLDHPSRLVRRRAAALLARYPTPELARALWARVGGDPDPWLRALGADALGRACLEDARDLLADLRARDPSLDVRHAAARSLRRLSSAGIEALLTAALADRAYQVRLAARQALRERAQGPSDCPAPTR